MRKVAIVQSNYLPWKGYFDLIHDADEFIFYDDLQFTKNDWRNRNKIKTPKGAEWLTIPAGRRIHRLIHQVELKRHDWQAEHWRRISRHYDRAPYFAKYRPFFDDFYLGRVWDNLSDLNQYLIKAISRDLLGIDTPFRDSREYGAEGKKLDRLMDLLKKAGAGAYVSGPAARSYIEESRFSEAGIKLIWKSYSGYPEYSQSYPPFEHGVSVLDLLFQTGPDAAWHIWGWREDQD